MLEVLTIWILGYVIIGVGLAVMIDDIKYWQRLLLIIFWPIAVAFAVLVIIFVLINSTIEFIKDFIKDCRR